MWEFKANPRELQFFIVGIVFGASLIAFARYISAELAGSMFIVCILSALIFLFMAFLRGGQ